MTLLQMATQQRSRMQNMVLVASASYYPEECRSIQRELTPESAVWDWESLRGRHAYGDEQIRGLLTQFHNFKDSYDDMNFTKPYLSTITARTLVVHGDRDPFFPVSIPIELYSAIPQSSLWIIPDGDHVELLTGHEMEFAHTVLKFLSGSRGVVARERESRADLTRPSSVALTTPLSPAAPSLLPCEY
jgi:pimeloyl-ACP methyl ester carboxylesterase